VKRCLAEDPLKGMKMGVGLGVGVVFIIVVVIVFAVVKCVKQNKAKKL
jgi:hypothetical protein